jgi:outer membrane protein OmpA-like peptidoglycan-associated protein
MEARSSVHATPGRSRPAERSHGAGLHARAAMRSSARHPIGRLHRTVGNSMTARLLQRTCHPKPIAAKVAGRGECTDKFDDTFVAGPLFKFKQDCDEFAIGQDLALATLATPLRALTTTFDIHGYASVDGPVAFNQDLACARAMEAKRLLTDAGPRGGGIPASRIKDVINHGPVAGPASERRSVVVPTTTPPPPEPPSVCPTVPSATPPDCVGRNGAYCAAEACFSTDPWLKCVCSTSIQICQAVNAFNFTSTDGRMLEACIDATVASPLTARGVKFEANAKGQWFLDTNKCIWEHWRRAMDALHDPSRPIPSGLTAPWVSAITVCRSKGMGHKDCCEAQVDAEQRAIDDCGAYDSRRFGKLPTDIPGAATCSAAAKRFAPPPPFTGDFGSVADRIAYGKKRCCP